MKIFRAFSSFNHQSRVNVNENIINKNEFKLCDLFIIE
jgi:hypothetical protein